MSNPNIKYVRNKDIDRAKWDRCISLSANVIAYAYSWLLDRLCPGWNALILGDYLYVMPLPNNRKYLIRYIFQPPFMQQLGIFSASPIDAAITEQFFEAIPKRYGLIEINLNLGNTMVPPHFAVRQRTTYHLSLNAGVEKIRSGYNDNTRRNIKKAMQHNISVSRSTDVATFVGFTRSNLQAKAPSVKAKHYSALSRLITYALDKGYGEIYEARDEDKRMLAAVFFLKTNDLIIYLVASSNRVGTEKSAMFVLIDRFIEQNAGIGLSLDFEGSDIAGVARFYAGFGAQPKTYLAVRQNRLPVLIRYFKR